MVWEIDIATFEEKLLETPAKVSAIFFIGSSSIRFWDFIEQDMKPFDVVQRGFGGSKFLDVVHYADRLLEIGVQPAAIGVLVGTNDVRPKTQPNYYIAIWSLLEKYVIGTPTRQSITLP